MSKYKQKKMKSHKLHNGHGGVHKNSAVKKQLCPPVICEKFRDAARETGFFIVGSGWNDGLPVALGRFPNGQSLRVPLSGSGSFQKRLARLKDMAKPEIPVFLAAKPNGGNGAARGNGHAKGYTNGHANGVTKLALPALPPARKEPAPVAVQAKPAEPVAIKPAAVEATVRKVPVSFIESLDAGLQRTLARNFRMRTSLSATLH